MIFFDIDGTLIDHLSASAAASLRFYDHFPRAIPFDREDFSVAWEKILDKHFERFCRGEISLWEQRRARMREVFAQPELCDSEADERYQVFVREYEQRTSAYLDAAPCLERLRGSSLGIISNGAREQQLGKLRRAGLLEFFSVLVFSEDVGLGKPASRIFLEACRLAGRDPAASIHVGDSLGADVMPSRALGMRGIFLDRTGRLPVDPPVISTLAELPGLLVENLA
ncbi:MAG: HAD family hydrolase [Acidobacteria bacterium]|nr:HAD family hydrolase [Acidobacteriota bacterium]